ncbi:MAG: hypothetical protein RIM84_15620 [Alphaproteobacteria bacterium]
MFHFEDQIEGWNLNATLEAELWERLDDGGLESLAIKEVTPASKEEWLVVEYTWDHLATRTTLRYILINQADLASVSKGTLGSRDRNIVIIDAMREHNDREGLYSVLGMALSAAEAIVADVDSQVKVYTAYSSLIESTNTEGYPEIIKKSEGPRLHSWIMQMVGFAR